MTADASAATVPEPFAGPKARSLWSDAARTFARNKAGMTGLVIAVTVILIAVFVWRGPKTLPQLGRMFGEGVRAVRREARRDGDHADDDASSPPETGGR